MPILAQKMTVKIAMNYSKMCPQIGAKMSMPNRNLFVWWINGTQAMIALVQGTKE